MLWRIQIKLLFLQEDAMIRERALKVVLVLVGLLSLAGVYPLWRWQPNQALEQMLGGGYAMLGVFLLLVSRNPSVNRNLIAFTTWAGFLQAAVMVVHFRLLSFTWHCS
jgi:hypothetical protein